MRKRSMQAVNANQEPGKKDTVWVFLAEYSLNEFMRLVEEGSELIIALLFQDLSISQEYLDPIIRTLADFAQQATMQTHPKPPGVVRLFCQEKMLKAGNPAEIMPPRPTVTNPETIPQAQPKVSGGWGYFLVERSGDFPEEKPASSPNLIELYLYREGK